MDEYTTKRRVIDATRAITYPRGGGKTNTWEALELVRNTIFERRNGDRDDVINIVFLITDGKPNMLDSTTGETPPEYTDATLRRIVQDLRREDDPVIIGVAVGEKENFQFMDEYTDFYRRVDAFDELMGVIDAVVERACLGPTGTIVPPTTPRNPTYCPDHIENMYMFSAVYEHPVMEGRMLRRLDMTIPFGEILINLGGAYSSRTSTFTCPCDGFYYFTAMMSDVNGIGIVIMRDNEVVSPMGYVSGNGHISTSAIVQCRVGQGVYVKLMMNQLVQNYLRCNFNDDMVLGGFSGHLLNTMF